jgi:hypothetical protein
MATYEERLDGDIHWALLQGSAIRHIDRMFEQHQDAQRRTDQFLVSLTER